jgi:hypothetical protein
MSGEVNPLENPQSWDEIVIGQTVSPGLVKVTGFKRSNEWDMKKGKGTVGATPTYVGKPPAKGTFVFYLWTKQHFLDWDIFRPLLKYDPTKKNIQAIDIWYPSLADIDCNSIIIDDIGAIEHEGSQLYSITVAATEYFPSPKKSAVGTPSGSVSTQKGTTPGAPPDPIADAQQKEIAALLKKASEP